MERGSSRARGRRRCRRTQAPPSSSSTPTSRAPASTSTSARSSAAPPATGSVSELGAVVDARRFRMLLEVDGTRAARGGHLARPTRTGRRGGPAHPRPGAALRRDEPGPRHGRGDPVHPAGDPRLPRSPRRQGDRLRRLLHGRTARPRARRRPRRACLGRPRGRRAHAARRTGSAPAPADPDRVLVAGPGRAVEPAVEALDREALLGEQHAPLGDRHPREAERRPRRSRPRTRSVSVRASSSQSARSKIPGSRSSQRPCVSLDVVAASGAKTSKTNRPPGASSRCTARSAARRSASVSMCSSERNGTITSGNVPSTGGSRRSPRRRSSSTPAQLGALARDVEHPRRRVDADHLDPRRPRSAPRSVPCRRRARPPGPPERRASST